MFMRRYQPWGVKATTRPIFAPQGFELRVPLRTSAQHANRGWECVYGVSTQ
jgi:hypothetical protein